MAMNTSTIARRSDRRSPATGILGSWKRSPRSSRAGTTIFGTPTPLELTLAERLSSLIPSAEMVRFTNSGTEATMHALRVARGVTGRSRIVKFEGHYHGVHDSVLFNLDGRCPEGCERRHPRERRSGRRPSCRSTIRPRSRAVFDEHDDIAAVIVEPIARGVIQPRAGFLQLLRDLTTRAGALLIFDEVVVWPRVGLAGAQGLLGVTPDLTALGKAIGGGLPLAALVGRREDLDGGRTARRARSAVRAVCLPRRHLQRHTDRTCRGTRRLDLLQEPGAWTSSSLSASSSATA